MGVMKIVRVIFVVALAALWAGAAGADVVSTKAKGGFAEVKDSVVLAIQAKGFKIDYTAYIGNMLERTRNRP